MTTSRQRAFCRSTKRIGALERLVGKLALENEFVNTPPPERRWLQITAQSRIGPPAADSGHIEVVVWFWRGLVLYVVGPDLVGSVAAALSPVTPGPQMLAPVALSQARQLAHQLMG